jgi:antitoxin VapB
MRVRCKFDGFASCYINGIYCGIYQTPMEAIMEQTAKLFANGRSQAVRLPAQFRFDTTEVFIRQDPDTHDVILSKRPSTWDSFFVALKNTDVPDEFLDTAERAQDHQRRDPFAETAP